MGWVSPPAYTGDSTIQNLLRASAGPTGLLSAAVPGPGMGMARTFASGAADVAEQLPGLAHPIKAYHGSPYDFDAFDVSKIGSGEGAQAYGHGLYFAEDVRVAKSYRQTGDARFNRLTTR